MTDYTEYLDEVIATGQRLPLAQSVNHAASAK